MVRNDYHRDNRYSVTHPDAIADGDMNGKGTGHGGHSFYLPDCNGTLNMIKYSNFDTSANSNAGNNTDNRTRKDAMVRSLYNSNNQYGVNSVNTDISRAAGQYQVP